MIRISHVNIVYWSWACAILAFWYVMGRIGLFIDRCEYCEGANICWETLNADCRNNVNGAGYGSPKRAIRYCQGSLLLRLGVKRNLELNKWVLIHNLEILSSEAQPEI
jgi:hypothetical protein